MKAFVTKHETGFRLAIKMIAEEMKITPFGKAESDEVVKIMVSRMKARDVLKVHHVLKGLTEGTIRFIVKLLVTETVDDPEAAILGMSSVVKYEDYAHLVARMIVQAAEAVNNVSYHVMVLCTECKRQYDESRLVHTDLGQEMCPYCGGDRIEVMIPDDEFILSPIITIPEDTYDNEVTEQL